MNSRSNLKPSGQTLEADIIVTATGFNLDVTGDIEFVIEFDLVVKRCGSIVRVLRALLFLPDATTKFPDFIARLTPENWSAWTARFQSGQGSEVIAAQAFFFFGPCCKRPARQGTPQVCRNK